MNIKKSYWIYICLFLASISIFVVRTASARCGGISSGCDSSVYRCPPTPQVRVRCLDFGIVTSEARQKLDYLKVVVTRSNGTQKIYTLHNPPGGIADYPAAGIRRNPWIINRLRSVLFYDDVIELAHDGYGLSPETLTVASSIDDKSLKRKCEYTGQPFIVNLNNTTCSSRNVQICVSLYNYCRNMNKSGKLSPGDTVAPAMIYCLAKNNKCPSPTNCAFHKRVELSKCVKEHFKEKEQEIITLIRYHVDSNKTFPLPRYISPADNYDENGRLKNDKGPLWHPPRNNDKGPLWHPPRSGEQESSGSLQ